jgi:hypothetical protein
MSERQHYEMGWDAGLEAAAALLDLGERGALRRDVTLTDLAAHIRLLKVDKSESLNHCSSPTEG